MTGEEFVIWIAAVLVFVAVVGAIMYRKGWWL